MAIVIAATATAATGRPPHPTTPGGPDDTQSKNTRLRCELPKVLLHFALLVLHQRLLEALLLVHGLLGILKFIQGVGGEVNGGAVAIGHLPGAIACV